MPDKAPETVVVKPNAIRLVRRADTPTWQAHYKVDKLGVWIRKSTKTTNLDEAREFAEEHWMEAKILAKNGNPVLSKKFKAVAQMVLLDLERKIAESGTKRGSNNDYVSAIHTLHTRWRLLALEKIYAGRSNLPSLVGSVWNEEDKV